MRDFVKGDKIVCLSLAPYNKDFKIGETYTFKSYILCTLNNQRRIEVEEYPQSLYESRFKLAPPVKNTFSKSDLKTGMQVIFAGGYKGIVQLNTENQGDVVVFGSHQTYRREFVYLKDIEEDLSFPTSPSYAIVQVGSIKHINQVFTKDEVYEILWKKAGKTPEQVALEEAQAQMRKCEEEMAALKVKINNLKV
jgi:hypothetical protein